MRLVYILNFSDIYKEEDFYLKYPFTFVDLKDIKGTQCILSEDAKKELKKRLSDVLTEGIHFLDSGNYHYMSLFFIERIKAPFTLIVFDHHTDMTKDAFSNLITCGNWILHIKNPNLMKIIEIGPKDAMGKKILQVSDSKLLHASTAYEARLFSGSYPVYISIDKDCLSPNVVKTDWNQGIMTEESLIKALDEIFLLNKVIGIDICGEFKNEMKYLSNIPKDNRINEDLLKETEKNI